MCCQLHKYIEYRLEQMGWQCLGFIEYDHTLSKTVEFAAWAGSTSKQALEELHRGGHHNRCIPIFSSQPRPLLPWRELVLFALGMLGATMVFQHHGRIRIACAKKSAIRVGRLLCDTDKRYGHNHPLKLMCQGVAQCKSHARAGFATAGGHCEAEPSWWQRRRRQTCLVDRMACSGDDALILAAELALLLFQPPPECCQGYVAATLCCLPFIEVMLRVQKIGIHER